MKTASPTLLPLLHSPSQGDILATILLDPEHERSLSEIAEETGVSVATVLREVGRLEEGGFVTTTRRGNTRLVRAVTDSVVYRPLAGLLAVTFIYGSWAARYAPQSGPVPNDIDLLVIGNPDRHVLADAVAEAERVLRREVNVRRHPRRMGPGRGSFKKTVLSHLIGGPDE
jgi:DNA-binding transcriptional ArsR family regulator